MAVCYVLVWSAPFIGHSEGQDREQRSGHYSLYLRPSHDKRKGAWWAPLELKQGKVINVQPGFLGWFLTKTHSGMEEIA